ncbi:MAG: hypothetical protein II746_04700 [Bacteroidaceae bacterium]|nr:hypothetical protein [Bacteroidaceae bacterium]
MRKIESLVCCLFGLALTMAAQTTRPFGLAGNKGAQSLHQSIQTFLRMNSQYVKPLSTKTDQDTIVMRSWNFSIPKRVGEGMPKQLQKIIETFERTQGSASSYTTRNPMPEPIPFGELRFLVGRGKDIQCSYTNEMHVRAAVFDGENTERNSYILVWWEKRDPMTPDTCRTDGYVYECYGHVPYSITDYQLPAIAYNPITHQPIPDGTQREYVALHSKVNYLLNCAQTADSTEMTAIITTARKEVEDYRPLLTKKQASNIQDKLKRIKYLATQKNVDLFDLSHAEGILTIYDRLQGGNFLDERSLLEQDYCNLNRITCYDNMIEDRDTLIQSGEHYLGDPRIPYIEPKLHSRYLRINAMPYRSKELADGIYRLKIAVRGEAGTHHGRGITIQSFTGITMEIKAYEIPACGNTGGTIWEEAKAAVEKAKAEGREPAETDMMIAQANGGKGFGWNWLVIDGIRVKDNSPFMYSIMNRSEKRDENIVYPWMSVCDCIVERTGDLPE